MASNEYQQNIGHVWQRSLGQLDENHSSAKQQNHTLNSDLELYFAAPRLAGSSPPASCPFRGGGPASLSGHPHLSWSSSRPPPLPAFFSCPPPPVVVRPPASNSMASNMTSNVASTVEALEFDPKTDPARKAKSNDPGWKCAYWQDPARRDWVICTLCGNESSGGIKRLKQHLAGGYGDIILCPKIGTEIRKEMQAYLQKKRRRPLALDDIEEEAREQEDEVVEVAAADVQGATPKVAVKKPSSGTAAKKRHAIFQLKASRATSVNSTPKTPKTTQSIVGKLKRTPEQIVDERRAKV